MLDQLNKSLTSDSRYITYGIIGIILLSLLTLNLLALIGWLIALYLFINKQ